MKKKNPLRKLLKNPLAHPVAVAIGAVTAVGAAAYGIHRWRRAMRLPPGEPTGGNTLEPGSGGGGKLPTSVPKVYVSVKSTTENGFLEPEVVTSSTVAHYSGVNSSAEIKPETVPVDVVVSVPANFDPIKKLNLGTDATLVAGTPGTSRDLIVRVAKRSKYVAFSVSVSYGETINDNWQAFDSTIDVYVK